MPCFPRRSPFPPCPDGTRIARSYFTSKERKDVRGTIDLGGCRNVEMVAYANHTFELTDHERTYVLRAGTSPLD